MTRPNDKPPERLRLDRMATPVGEALIVTDEDGVLRGFDWHGDTERLRKLMKKYYPKTPLVDGPAPAATRQALEAYFAGDVHAIDGLAWRSAGTDFQQSVWRALCDIPAGTTISYGELARRIGKPKAVRAVGLANGANPNGLIAPCHRVIGANGSLTGYGGGMHRKKWLLEHEGAAFRVRYFNAKKQRRQVFLAPWRLGVEKTRKDESRCRSPARLSPPPPSR